MGELVKRPAGSNADRELAARALDLNGWTDDLAMIAELGGSPVVALELLEAMLVPAKEIEPNGLADGKRGPKTNKLMQSLRAIGAKISPTMSGEQVDVWIVAMTTALSDLPFSFSTKGAADAIHVPMKFLNEVETVVREKAEAAATRHRIAMHRLRTFERQLKAASEPALPPPEPRDFTQDEINSMSPPLLRIGLKNEWITQEQYDSAMQGKDDADEN